MCLTKTSRYNKAKNCSTKRSKSNLVRGIKSDLAYLTYSYRRRYEKFLKTTGNENLKYWETFMCEVTKYPKSV